MKSDEFADKTERARCIERQIDELRVTIQRLKDTADVPSQFDNLSLGGIFRLQSFCVPMTLREVIEALTARERKLLQQLNDL